MKTHIRYELPLFFLLALAFLAGCGAGAEVIDVQVVPAAQAQADAEPPEWLKPLAMVLLNGTAADRAGFVRFQTLPCSVSRAGQALPGCQPAGQNASSSPVFPVERPERAYLTAEEINQVLDLDFGELVAIYRPQGSAPANGGVADEMVLLFDRQQDGAPAALSVVVQAGWLVRLVFHPGETAEALLNRIPVGQVTQPPASVKSWLDALRQYRLQSLAEISPDRRWSAYTLLALPPAGGERYYRRLVVTSQNGALVYPLVDEWGVFGADYRIPKPLAWFGMSPTEFPLLYWTNLPGSDTCPAFRNGADLQRLKLAEGAGQALLSDVGNWLSVSPDQSRAAVAGADGLSIYDLTNGQRRSVALPPGQAGQVIWSPDGRQVALTVADRAGDPCEATTHTLLLVDADTLAVKLRVANDPRRLFTESWSQLGMVKLDSASGQPWLLDPQSGETWDPQAGRPTAVPKSASPAEIRFYANLYEEDVAALQKLADGFAAENPGMRVIFQDYGSRPEVNSYDNSVDNLLASLMSAGDCMVDFSMPNEYSRRSDLLLDLGPLLQTDGADLSRDYWPEQLDGYRLDGKLYALPMFERPSMIHYNADLLAQKGLPAPAPDWTYADFDALLAKVTSEQSGDRVYGFPVDDGSFGQFIEGLFSPVFDTATVPPTANFTSPEMAAGLQRLADLRSSGVIVYLPGTLYADQNYYDAADAWAAGRMAFWQFPYGEATPFPASEKLPTFQVGLAPLPEHGPLFRNGYSVQQNFYIGKDSPNAAGCLAWYRYVTEHPDAMPAAPARRSMLQDPAWRTKVGEANAAALETALERVYTEPLRFSMVMNPADPLISYLYTAVIDYFNGAEAQLVMAIAQHKADAYAACMAPAASLTGEALGQAVIQCARQVEPDRW